MAASRVLYDLRQRQSLDRLAIKIRRDFTLLDFRDLDATWPGYLEASGYSVRTEWDLSMWDMLLYLFDLMADANNPPTDLKRPVFSEAHVRNMLWLTGPGRVKQLVDAGYEQQAAMLSAGRASVLAARNKVAVDVREATQQASEDATDFDDQHIMQGYLRIAKPTACKFCLRLAGATAKVGLVYHVTTKWRHPHENCRCDIEPQPVYKVAHLRHPEEIVSSAELYARLRRQRDEAAFTAMRGLSAA